MSKLDGRVALVTGASKGIGAGIAKELAAAGSAVVVNYATDRIGADVVVKEISDADGRALAIQADVSKSDDVRRLLADVKNAFGSLDILVNNAGVYRPMTLIYAASKSAVDAITGVLAKELAPRKIRVNSINPGATLSEGTKAAGLYGVGSEFERRLVDMTPLGRVGTPLDIAKITTFLASNDSGWLTGEIILASGGLR